jgi:GT2 family glycosyltransferase|tara:strand:- start:4512 stop:5600 length:1089 start_codon:yes stop_codon:yes gene_type:complete
VTIRVCVIIPTVDNSAELAVVLDGLTKQTFKGIDVAVVGPSEDQGRRVTEERGFRFIDDKGSRNRADACNVAIEETDSELVFFTDDDVIVPQDWVEKLEKWFQRPEVAGVGGPNFAPVDQSTIWQKAIDVAFCNKFLTAGTNYGKRSEGTLEEVEQLPGVNSAYRRKVLEEVGGFDSGAIGAEDVMLDHRIRLFGHRLWSDGTATMWHRRRGIKRVRKQIRNYGLVRTLAGKRYPSLWGWSHGLVSTFPVLVCFSLATFIWGCLNGGLAWPEFWDISVETVPLGLERASVHQFPTLVVFFNFIAWSGAILGPSPSKSSVSVFLSPIVSFMLLWDYGIGINKARISIITGSENSQIDDRDRNQ